MSEKNKHLAQNAADGGNQGKKAPDHDNRFQKEQPLRHELARVVQDQDKLEINDQLYKIVINKNGALDSETLRKKYDPYLDQYDFLVGDVSSEHLRLKGFYHDTVRTAINQKEQAIADYLLEYCNPGGAYFVLQLLKPVHHYHARLRNTRNNRSNHRGYRDYSRKNKTAANFKRRRVHQTNFKKHKMAAVKKKQSYHHSFVIRKRKDSN